MDNQNVIRGRNKRCFNLTAFVEREGNYLTQISREIDDLGRKNVLYVEIQIYKGVFDFLGLSSCLKLVYPNIQELIIRQDHSYSPGMSTSQLIEDFKDFIKILELKSFYLDDCRSNFLKTINYKNLYEILPYNSNYTIKSRGYGT